MATTSPSDEHYFYHVTAKRPDSVLHSIRSNFTGETDVNLLLNKGNHFEIYVVNQDGGNGSEASLSLILDVPVYGKIATFETFRPKGAKTDFLVFTTEKYQLSIVSFAWTQSNSSQSSASSGHIITHASGNIRDSRARPAETGQLGLIDPQCRAAGFYMTQGLFKVVPIYAGDVSQIASWKSFDQKSATSSSNAKGKQVLRGPSLGEFGEAFNVRLDKLLVISLSFLHTKTTGPPQLGVLFQDARADRHFMIYNLDIENKELVDTGISTTVESGASILIPVPATSGGGVIIVGENSIVYFNCASSVDQQKRTGISIKPTIIKAFNQMDENGSRYLLHDYNGVMYVLALFEDNRGVVNDIKMDSLGQTVQPTTVTYLMDGYVFVGSHFGDAELVHLSTKPDESGSCISVKKSFSNLSPITDFCLVDLDQQGQGQIVACCGAQKDGSIRVIRNGIGIEEIGELEDVGEIRGLWSLREKFNSSFDQILVMSFVGETRFQKMGEEALEELEDGSGFVTNEMTIQSATVKGDYHVQVTHSSILLVACDSLMCASEWRPEGNGQITQAAINDDQIIVSVGGVGLYCISFTNGELKTTSHAKVDLEVACIDASQVHLEGPDGTPRQFCAVGFWTEPSVCVYTLPGLEKLSTQSLPGDTIPRSIIMTTLESKTHLMVALGDGQLFHFGFNRDGSLHGMKRIALGTQPIALKLIQGLGEPYVFASCDRPTFIYSRSGKLCFSNVNLRQVSAVTRFHTPLSENAIAFSTEGSLKIGCIETMQKLHVKTYPIRETCRRIVYSEVHRMFGIVSCQPPLPEDSTPREKWFFRILDSQTFEVISSHELAKNEMAMSMMVFEDGSGTSYFVVGTGYVVPHEDEPSQGRLLVFGVDAHHKLEMLHEKPLKGCIYALETVRGKLIAGVNSKVMLFNWVSHTKSFDPVCTHHGHVLALCLEVRGDFVIVGDLMKSICVLLLDGEGSRLNEIARDYEPNWMTALTAVDDDLYIGAENHYNLFVLKKRSDAGNEEDRKHLQVVGRFHLGELVNRFQRGSLVMQTPDQTPVANPEILYCTVNGTIGVLATIKPDIFQLLSRVQTSMQSIVQGAGNLDHSLYRKFQNDRIAEDMSHFIDGDLIELFSELDSDSQKSIAQTIDMDVDSISRIIEDLTRIH